MRWTKTLALAILVGSPLAAQTVDEILDKHFAALGGKEKIAAVQSARIHAKQIFGPQEVPATILWKRPDKIRMEFTLQGLTGIQAYDGKDAWQVMPFLGKNDPEAMTGDDLKDIIDNADLVEGPLFNYQEKGNTVELLGKEAIEGTDAWKLKLTQKNGDVSTIWLDADAMLQIKSEGTRKRGDKEIDFEQSYGDYKEVGGLMFAHSIESKPKGAPQGATITIDSIELGVDIPDSTFAMPPKPETPKPASGAEG